MTIIGLIPVGGKGTRLGLPFPKEMLPQKGFDKYNPIINHTVSKMLDAGAEYLYFIHGTEIKQEIVDYYPPDKYCHHIKQKTPGFASVLSDFYEAYTDLQPEDIVLFGLPDSIYEGNPFKEMVDKPGVVCGLFTTSDDTHVDRLDTVDPRFWVKTPKQSFNQNLFWGVLKFDYSSLSALISMSDGEIGMRLNYISFTTVSGGSYLDLGTWVNYNKYLIDYKEQP